MRRATRLMVADAFPRQPVSQARAAPREDVVWQPEPVRSQAGFASADRKWVLGCNCPAAWSIQIDDDIKDGHPMNGSARALTVAIALLAAVAARAGGVGALIHPIAPTPPELVAAARSLPDCARDHVHVFLLNGLDPLRLGNLDGLAECVRSLGFSHVYYGELWDGHRTARRVRQIRSDDPGARIILLGYSFGANLVRSVTHEVAHDGIKIDLLIYLVGDTVFDGAGSMPGNACRVINIRAWGWVLLAGGLINGQDLTGAENVHLRCVRHLCVPMQPAVQELLARELVKLTPRPSARLLGIEAADGDKRSAEKR